jgi:hypothetical protein
MTGIGGEKIAVAPGGVAWITDTSNDIYKRNKGSWVQMPGKARDLAIGGSIGKTKIQYKPTVFSLGMAKVAGGYEIFKYYEDTKEWKSYARGAINIAVDPFGNLWYVTEDYQVFR